ncbi:MAG: hypothetical protein ACI8W7_004572 [Gammaproteobacteria bacterium]
MFIARIGNTELSLESVMSQVPQNMHDCHSVAEHVRTACIAQAIRAYEQAGICGLCHEGRFEAAISALQMLDVVGLLSDEPLINAG